PPDLPHFHASTLPFTLREYRMRTTIAIQGAREHNLKNVSLELPRDQLIVVTGVSGSGKSSLAFDTIYAEGKRRYMESLSSDARPDRGADPGAAAGDGGGAPRADLQGLRRGPGVPVRGGPQEGLPPRPDRRRPRGHQRGTLPG